VSQSNGDKARFSRERKKKALKRKRNRELRKALGIPKAASQGNIPAPKAA